jgi:hypothetical protein
LKFKWWYSKSECTTQVSDEQENGNKKPLKFIDVAGVFYILIGGIALSLIVCVLEFVYHSKLESVKKSSVKIFLFSF